MPEEESVSKRRVWVGPHLRRGRKIHGYWRGLLESGDYRLSSEVLNDSTHEGGSTRTPKLTGGKTFTSGYSVAEHPERTSILPLDSVSLAQIERWIEQNADLLYESDGTGRQHAVGAWIAPMVDDGGKPYGPDLLWLDVATVYPKDQRARAIDAGITNNQQAIWDFEAGAEIRTGGTGVMKVAQYSERRRLVGIFDPKDPQFILDQIRAAAMQIAKATDGDGDGFVNDGTKSQRPVGPQDRVAPGKQGGSLARMSGVKTKKRLTKQQKARIKQRTEARAESSAKDRSRKAAATRAATRAARGASVDQKTITSGKPGDSPAKPLKVKSAKKALDLIAQGKHVELDPDTLAVMLDKLAKIGQDAFKRQQKGEKVTVPDYDLCRVHVRDTNVYCEQNKGIPRIDMPQLAGKNIRKGSRAQRKLDQMNRRRAEQGKPPETEVNIADEFVAELQRRGIKITDGKREASKLKATQSQIVGSKVGGMMAASVQKGGKLDLSKPIFISRDGYILDGHHRWAALTGLEYTEGSPMMMNVRVIDMPIQELVGLTNEFALQFGVEPNAATALNKQQPPQPGHPPQRKKALTARQIQQRRLAAAKRKRPEGWNGRCYNLGYARAHPEECGGKVKKGDEPCCDDCADRVVKEGTKERRKTQKALTARQIQQRRNAAAKRRRIQQDDRPYRKTGTGWAVATRGYAAAHPDEVKTRYEIEYGAPRPSEVKKRKVGKRKSKSDAWLASHPSPLSTPKEIVGHHGHRPHGPSIRWPALYEHLRKKGMSKAKAAAISNAGWKKKRMGIPTNTPMSVRGVAKKQPLKDPDGGLTAAGRKAFGGNLKPGVKSYDKASLADKKRWVSWALRFYGQDEYPPLKKPNGEPTRFALTAAAWGEPVPSTEEAARAIAAKARKRQSALDRVEKAEFSARKRVSKMGTDISKSCDGDHDKLKRGQKCKSCGKTKLGNKKMASLPVKGDEQQTEILMKEEVTKFPLPAKMLTPRQKAQRRQAALKSARRRRRLRHKGITAAKNHAVRVKRHEHRRKHRQAAEQMRHKRRAAWAQQRASAGKALQTMANEAVGVGAMEHYKVAPFAVGKSFDMSGTDDDKRLVFGWAYVTHDPSGNLNVDKSGDFVEHPEELEDAAYDFVLHSRQGGLNHERTDTGPVVKSTLVESVVITPEKMDAMGIPDGAVPTGWWVGFKIEDEDLWSEVKDGKYKSFSIHGSGVRSQVQL